MQKLTAEDVECTMHGYCHQWSIDDYQACW
jgi:hypothetical protein